MRKSLEGRVIWFVLFLSLLAPMFVQAQQPPVPKFEILSIQFVEKVVGSEKTWSTNDASKSKGAVLLIKVTLPDDQVLWVLDFSLGYIRGGSDDRASCRGLTSLTSSEEDEGAWMIGDYANVRGKKGIRYFQALFGLENEVNNISLLYKQPVVTSFSFTRK